MLLWKSWSVLNKFLKIKKSKYAKTLIHFESLEDTFFHAIEMALFLVALQMCFGKKSIDYTVLNDNI